MKKSTFWKLSFTAALLFGLSACNDTVSSDDDGDNTASSSSTKGGKVSSSSTTTSSSSVKKDSAYCAKLDATLSAPTDLSVVKNGDNKWLLLWNYSANEEREEEAFIIEILSMSDSVPKWKTLDSTNAAVTMYNLSGEDKSGKYYRVSAKDGCGISRPTDMIQVSAAGSGSTTASADLAVPTDLKIDTLGNNLWQLSWSYTNNVNRPEDGFKLQTLDISADSPKWKDDVTTNKGVSVVKIDGNKKGGLLVHVAAKDTNGISEYSASIMIPTVSDSTEVNEATALAVPTDLKLDSMGDNKWKLSWSYTDNTSRPENGFRLQYLDLTAKDINWTKADSTKQNVKYVIIDATKRGGQYVRVAARDSKGDSKYSTEVMVPNQAKAGDAIDVGVAMNVPTDLKIDSVGQNKYRLSWSYADNSDHPENGFKIQKLDLNGLAKWENLGTTAKGVHYLQINRTAKDTSSVFVHVAAKDKNDSLSDYSAEILVPAYKDYTLSINTATMAAPTNVKLDTLGFGQYQLSWDYDDYADNGFVLQSLEIATNAIWTVEPKKKINKGVHLVILDGMGEDGGKLFRVAALGGNDKKDTSAYSSAIALPKVTADGIVDDGTITTALVVPQNLTVTDLGMNKFKLSWNYTNSSVRPATGFIIEKLDANKNGSSWEEVNKTDNGVTFYIVDASTAEMTYRVAAEDSKGQSDYSSEVTVPAAYAVAPKNGCVGEFSQPINFKAERVAPNAWRLIWDYSRNTKCVEEGFVVQQLDVTGAKREWVDLDSTDINVQYYNLEGIANLNQYYRVAAKRGSHRTPFSSDVQITRLIEYSADVPFITPTVKARIYYHFVDYFDESAFDASGNLLPGKEMYTKYPHFFDYETVIEGGYPNHAIVYYKNTINVEYQFRWNNEEYQDWVTVGVTDTTGKTKNEYRTVVLRELDNNKYKDYNRLASELCHHYSQARIIWTVKDGDAVVVDTTDWSEPVGPIYNSFEYLESPGQSTDCEALFTEDQKEDGTYKNTPKYKSCNYYQPLGYRPCQST